MEPGDILVDGGNSYYVDDLRRSKELQPKRIHYVDVGTSGGVKVLERGYCLMIGGEPGIVEYLKPVFSALAPEHGYLHCGPSGAGPLREDGAQRNRVRNHVGICRRLEHSAIREYP